MSGGLYANCRSKVEAVQQAYDDLLRSLDDYVEFLDGEVAAEEAKSDPDKQKLIALSMQRKGANLTRENLETRTLDDLIRFSDRVIRIKHWEDGLFL